jgi:hypothetical protein
VKVKNPGLVSILETGGFVMTELRRTNIVVGGLRAEREFSVLRSCEFVPVARMSDDSVRVAGLKIIEAPPL